MVAKDTPNFIGNHIALYGVACMLRALASGRYSIEEIDAITGPAIGRPGSATFRTMDIAGVDVLAHVMRNLHERLAEARDRDAFVVPPFVDQMIARGQLGEKTGKGFYERRKGSGGESEIWTLDWQTLEYRPKQAAEDRVDRGRQVDGRPRPNASGCCSTARTRPASSSARRWRRRWSTRRASRRRSLTASTTWIA